MKSKPKDVEFKHWCGCITMKYKDGVAFKKMCKRHQLNRKSPASYVWIASQHPTEDSNLEEESFSRISYNKKLGDKSDDKL